MTEYVSVRLCNPFAMCCHVGFGRTWLEAYRNAVGKASEEFLSHGVDRRLWASLFLQAHREMKRFPDRYRIGVESCYSGPSVTLTQESFS